MKNTIKVVIADDHHIVLDGLESLIKATDDIEVIGLGYNGHHILKIVELNQLDVDVAVLDIEMPVMDGLEAARKIKAEYPNIKVLILTMYNDESYIREIIAAGASGYILKNKGSNELVNAIRAIHKGEEYFSKSVTDTLIKSIQEERLGKKKNVSKLTEREKEVLELIGQGMTTKGISEELSIAATTVETHRRHLIDKLGVKNSKELMLYVAKHGVRVPVVEKATLIKKEPVPAKEEIASEKSTLTEREQEVLSLIGEGLSTKEIAGKLDIAAATVESHRSHLIEKLEVKSTKDLVKYAITHGLVKSSPLQVTQAKLTRREKQILGVIGEGLTTKEICEKLSMRSYTVEFHRRNLINKIGAKNSKELIRYAIENGFTNI